MSLTLRRTRVIVVLLVLVILRRISRVPLLPFVTGVNERTWLGAPPSGADGSSRLATNPATPGRFPLAGLLSPSGPGEPNIDCTPLKAPAVVETKTKSPELLSVSCATKPFIRRTKLYSPALVPSG